jgi:hypothetical protein
VDYCHHLTYNIEHVDYCHHLTYNIVIVCIFVFFFIIIFFFEITGPNGYTLYRNVSLVNYIRMDHIVTI